MGTPACLPQLAALQKTPGMRGGVCLWALMVAGRLPNTGVSVATFDDEGLKVEWVTLPT